MRSATTTRNRLGRVHDLAGPCNGQRGCVVGGLGLEYQLMCMHKYASCCVWHAKEMGAGHTHAQAARACMQDAPGRTSVNPQPLTAPMPQGGSSAAPLLAPYLTRDNCLDILLMMVSHWRSRVLARGWRKPPLVGSWG
jgi:hypothetical protein